MIVGVMLLLSALLMLFQNHWLDIPQRYEKTPLDSGWEYTERGISRGLISLSRTELPDVREGDTYEIERVLPDTHLPTPAIMITAKQAILEISLDGEEIYRYGRDLHGEGRMLKRGFFIVPIPEDYGGKKLFIRYTATEQDAFSKLGPITLGNGRELWESFLNDRRLPVLLGGFFLIYSLFQLLWVPYLFFNRRDAFLSTLFGALITMVLGLYLFGNYDLWEVFGSYSSGSTVAEYATMYSMPALFSAYLGTLLKERARERAFTIALVDLVMLVAVLALHAGGRVHLTSFVQLFYVVALAEGLMFFRTFRKKLLEIRRARMEALETITDYAVFLGFFIFILMAFVDVIRYILTGLGVHLLFEGIPYMMFGSVCFTMTLTAQFFLHAISHLRADVTRGQLEQRAYRDPLTGLSNRIRCEQKMMELRMEDPFVIISFDLDGLKTVNDSLGHAEGDRMLEGFADALNKCFAGMTLTGRMGGDEFLVILTGSECVVTEAKLKELEHILFDMNLEEPYFHYSVSYGYASNTETHFGNHVRDIYMLADRRMYDMKRKRKQEKEADDV